jgi:hypothetical protein
VTLEMDRIDRMMHAGDPRSIRRRVAQ